MSFPALGISYLKASWPFTNKCMNCIYQWQKMFRYFTSYKSDVYRF